MKIETGKYYRTRDGRKVGPMEYNSNGCIVGDCWFGTWLGIDKGNYVGGRVSYVNPHNLDLIAELEDEPDTHYAALAAKHGIKITEQVGEYIVEYDGRK